MGVISVFKKLYGEFWEPRMEHILRNVLLELLETPGSTLLTLLRLFTDTRLRQPLGAKLQGPVVRNFWQKKFASLPQKFQSEAVAGSDAEPLSLQFGGDLGPPDLMRLPRYQAYVRLLIDGMPNRPFSMRTLPPPARHHPRRPQIIRRTSQHRYGRSASRVEREAHRFVDDEHEFQSRKTKSYSLGTGSLSRILSASARE